ncbi:hypothetical protein, partial [Phytoactinopolyspora endophytica]|uniref:hypothetical protein n=1 Tax=Phytoactinopolyspora endophytica TaxID=1642495 RepID=UPI00101C176C
MHTTEVFAHGVGGRQDLPIPLSFAVAGAAIAVGLSFVAMAVLWRRSRLTGDSAGQPIPVTLQQIADSAVTRATLRVAGLAAAAFVAVAAIFGPDDPTNPTAGFVYVVFWVGLVPASLLFGPVWRLLNPLRTVHQGLAALVGIRPEQGIRTYPPWLGYWPAAAGLLAFTWMELVAPDRTASATLLLWFTTYGVVQLLGALTFGSGWFDRADAFEAYSALIGRLAPLGRRDDGRLVLRNPLDGLDGVRLEPGLVAVVAVLLGSTAYDSFSNAPVWVQAMQTSSLSPTVLGALGFSGAILLVAGAFGLGVSAAGRTGAAGHRRLPTAFAHSIVPIAVGYLIAHYFSLFLFEGQRTIILASDPLGTGANLLGTADRQVDFALVTPGTIALVQVLAVVTGHVVGVVAAHDRAVRLFPPRRAVLGQLPLLVLMIAYTVG